MSPTPSSDAALLEQWHHLTSYIVSLEKEVQYYKQIIDEYQQAQSVYTSHSAQIVGEEQSGTNSQTGEDSAEKKSAHETVVEEGEGSYLGALFGHAQETQSQQVLKQRQVQTDQDHWDRLIESE